MERLRFAAAPSDFDVGMIPFVKFNQKKTLPLLQSRVHS